MKTIKKLLLLPVLFILGILEPASKLLSRTAQIIVTAIGSFLFLIVLVSAVFGIAPVNECLRNGIVIAAAATIVNFAAVVPALLESARTVLSDIIE